MKKEKSKMYVFKKSKPKITLHVKKGCPYCENAKRILKENGIKFSSKELNKQTASMMKYNYNYTTVPMVFVGKTFIGGYDQLEYHIENDLLHSPIQYSNTCVIL